MFSSRESRIPASDRKRSSSPEMGSLPAGTTGGCQEEEPPAKRRRLSEEEQPLHRLKNENVRSSDAERDHQASVGSLEWECECVVELATEVCRVEENGREECKKLHEEHGLELLNRYRTEMQRYVPTHLTRYSLLTVSTQGLGNGPTRDFV